MDGERRSRAEFAQIAAGTGPAGVAPARFAVSGLAKRFGAATVLKGVDLSLQGGRIVALMGANGAGKSTLVKIVAGVHDASEGTMAIDGQAFAPASPGEAMRAGIVVVHQAINDNVVLDMDLLENLMIDRICRGGSLLFRRGAHRAEAGAMAARVGLVAPLNRRVADLSLADRQLVAIARALSHDPKLLILDEPTSALSDAEADNLFEVLEGLRDRGVAILYISHRMGDIRRLADRVLTLRDGRLTGDFSAPIDYAGAVHAMLGRDLSGEGVAAASAGPRVMRIADIEVAPGAPGLSLDLFAGQVTAVVGLVGAGKTELAECLYGVRHPAGGAMALEGKSYTPKAPTDAVRAGVYMVPEDRSGGSIVADFDVAANISLPFLSAFSLGGFVNRAAERRNGRRAIADLGIVAPGETAAIGSLSGGNQQKVVLARWLTGAARLLILDEPFQGVDIAARRDIGATLRATARTRATLVLCADLDEALEIADRIVVMRNGRIVADLAPPFDRTAIVARLSHVDAARTGGALPNKDRDAA